MKTFYFLFLLSLGGLSTGCSDSPSTEVDTSEKTAAAPEPSKQALAAPKETTPSEYADTAPLPEPISKPSTIAYGIDVSKFQGKEIDMLDQSKDSLAFVICKATEGITYTDPDFRNNWAMIEKRNFIRGSYHFYRTADAPSLQADHYAEAIVDLKDTDLPPIIDIEGAGIEKSQSVAKIQGDFIRFLQLIEEKTNRTPMIYTDIPTANKYLNNPKFAEYALWIALYEQVTQPRLPDAWEGKRWVLWQKSSSYKIGNIKNDFDQFNGNVKSLRSFIKNY